MDTLVVEVPTQRKMSIRKTDYLNYIAIRKLKLTIATALFAIIIIIIVWITFSSPFYDYSAVRESPFCGKDSYYPRKFITLPFTTIAARAGIGNQLFEAISLMGIAEHLNRTAIFNSHDATLLSNLDVLRSSIPTISQHIQVHPFVESHASRLCFHVACCVYQWNRLLDCDQSEYLVVDAIYLQSFKYFANIENKVRRSLFETSAENRKRISRVLEEDEKSKFKTCVHVRRGDFLSDGVHQGTDANFTIAAIEYLHQKNGGTVIIFGNAPDWVDETIVGKLRIAGVRIMRTRGDQAIDDLIFSRMWCDSFLISAPSSTFGWWLGYLSKNASQVYYRDIYETDDNVKHEMLEEDFYPPKWTKMGQTRNGRIFLHN